MELEVTDNPLVEAVARAVAASEWEAGYGLEKLLYRTKNEAADAAWPDFCGQALAALRAIEDAGWKVVPVEATPEMEIAATEDWMTIRAAEDRAVAIWSAMLAAAPTFTKVDDSAR